MSPVPSSTAHLARPPKKSVFVTGANGYIGSAVCRAFTRAGWHVYGLVRRPAAASALAAEEVIPVVGSVSADLTWLDALLAQRPARRPFDVVVSCTEQLPFGAKPLVLLSSGCKDYGTTGRHGSPGLAPHTEHSPIDTLEILRDRANCSLSALAHGDLFDAAVLRPTPVYGYGSSYYAVVFDFLAAAAAAAREGDADKGKGKKLRVPADLDTIIHGCHVDDCAEAYVALASHADRGAVAGQCFNVSGYRYETLGDLVGALGPEYGVPSRREDVVAGPLGPGEGDADPGAALVLGYSQWVGSDKIRRLTGWSDRRSLISEDPHAYRLAYEAAVARGDETVARTRVRVAGTLANV